MTVASLENCKRLYELSGWSGTGLDYQSYDGKDFELKEYDANPPVSVPAYDLGYLLRKLPSFVDTTNNSYRLNITVRNLNDDKEAQMGYLMLRQVAHGKELIEFKNPRRDPREYGFEQLFWSPDKNSSGKPPAFFAIGTLEDAATLLAIKLFEEGILKG